MPAHAATRRLFAGAAAGQAFAWAWRAARSPACGSAKMDGEPTLDRAGAAVADNQSDLVILGGGSGGYAAALRCGRAGQVRGADREGQGRRHLPAPRLHPDQGAAARRRDRRRGAGERAFGVNATFEGIDMAGVHKYKDGVVGKNHKGLHRPDQEPRHRDRRGRGPAGRPEDRAGRRGHATPAPTSCWPPARTPASLPGLDIDGQRVIASEHALQLDHVPASAIVLGGGVIGCEFASAWTSFGTKVTIVEALPHLVPLEDEASSKLLERAFRRRKHRLQARRPVRGGRAHRHRRAGAPRGRRDARGRAAARRGRPRADVGRPRLRGAGRRDRARLRHRRRVLPHLRRRRLRGRRPDPHPAAGARRLRRGHPGRRAHRRAAGRADRLRRRPADHLQPARGRLGRAHRGAGGREVTVPTRSRRSPTTCPATAAARSSTPRARSSWSPSRTAPCSACTSSATGSAS